MLHSARDVNDGGCELDSAGLGLGHNEELGFYERQGTFWLAEGLVTSLELFCFMKFVAMCAMHCVYEMNL